MNGRAAAHIVDITKTRRARVTSIQISSVIEWQRQSLKLKGLARVAEQDGENRSRFQMDAKY